MTINSNTFINTINTRLANTTLANTDIDNAITSVKTLNSVNPVNTVSTLLNLPSALISKGRMIYVTDVAKYYYSDGASWISDFTPKNIPFYTLYSWGSNTCGKLGDGTLNAKCSPVSVVGGFTDWCQVSAFSGSIFTSAIRQNGTLWTWGRNSYGFLGDGTTVNKFSPVSVIGGFTDWCRVAAGSGASTAIRSNGTLWAWGLGCFGALGDGTTIAKCSPVSVVGGFTDWCQTSTGLNSTSAIRSNGSLWSFGINTCGILGDGTIVSKCSPISVVGGFTDWCQVSVGYFTAAAVRTNGTLWSWGSSLCGILGDGTTVCKSSPVSVLGGFTDWCQVSVGASHVAAVRQNGTIWTWGFGNDGRLGQNLSSTPRSSPVSVVGGFTDWCQVSAGQFHTAGVRTNGTLWTWGNNLSRGELGDGTVADKSSPISVIGINGGVRTWTSVCAAGESTFATLTDICR